MHNCDTTYDRYLVDSIQQHVYAASRHDLCCVRQCGCVPLGRFIMLVTSLPCALRLNMHVY